MKQNGMEPNNWTFPFLAKACTKVSNFKCSQIIHSHVMKSPFWSDVFVQTAMVDMYVKCNQLDDAYNLFVRMSMRDVASWNAILHGFAQSGFLDRVSHLLHCMRFSGIQPDSVTVMGLTRAVLHTKSLKLVKSLHSFAIQIGIDVDVLLANTWIAAYAKCGDLGLAEVVFNEIDIFTRTVVSWNSMIAGCANFANFFGAVNYYKCMLHEGFRPDLSTPLLVYFHHVCNRRHYFKCGDVDSARFLFDSMSDRTCVSWTVMISGYAEKGDMNEALTLFTAMEAAGDIPDLVTMLSLISGCGQIGALELGKWIDNYSISNGLKDNLIICNAFIDMYAKCGCINDARDLFYAIPVRSLVSWTTMIAGCALNGEFTEALNLFSQMVELGLKPNHITFLAALQACSHGDLLGRRGKLKEALEFIHLMPINPDAGIWGALLGACKVHCNVEIGEYVSHRLFELGPQVAVPYAEMANIYASKGRWDGVAAMRTMMKSNKVRKSPGQSLVQVKGKTHIFTVEHRDHPEGRLIYMMLDSLNLHLKKARLQLSSEADMNCSEATLFSS
uniref:Pentatricopeptide repeat-containing protein n=1 Tax=Quercus lobata TaxID=97700 RepID=A0A7N2RAY3_QUELO